MTKARWPFIGAFVAGAIALVVLIWQTLVAPQPLQLDWIWLGFIGLFVFTSLFGIPVGGGYVSLLPLTAVAACLTVGALAASWIAVPGELFFGSLRLALGGRIEALPKQSLADIGRTTSANVAVQAMSIFISGQIYHLVGGEYPLLVFDRLALLQFAALCAMYMLVNITLIASYLLLSGRERFVTFARSLPQLFLFEGLPLVFAPFMALVYSRLGLGWWLLFSLNFGLVSLIIQNLVSARDHLERRLKELAGLQAVGRVLSSSLNQTQVMEGIFQEVSGLMPANVFYVALYDKDENQVSFPLVIEDGVRIEWRSRQMGHGLTEYVLQTRKTLLIPTDVDQHIQKLGMALVGKTAESWLGVPILAADEALGVVAVQSYTQPGIYTESHARLLELIAAQAAIAIQNARLYARTDEALARRVRELDSILRTTSEGIMLVDLGWRVVAINPALARLLGNEYIDIRGRDMDSSPVQGGRTLISQVGYSFEDLQSDCYLLSAKKVDHLKQTVRLSQNDRIYERTLTPVRDRKNDINGWLLVFRDISEEMELARLREDMISMLVHDLRAPLATLLGSLNMMDGMMKPEQDAETLLNLAQRGGNRMMRLVNELLEISKLENGQLVVQKTQIDLSILLTEVAAQLQPLAVEGSALVRVLTPPNLPWLPGDHDLLSRVLYNLVDNAIKFSLDGGLIEVSAQVESGAMVVAVRDSGPGIPTELQGKLFNKFQRNPDAKSRRRGTGWGLYFCRLAVEAHGGKIWVESQQGLGSIFKFCLPLEEEQEKQA